MEIWINPECSKCQSATAALDEAGVSYTLRYYLVDPPTKAELEDVLARLDLQPWHITRVSEPLAHDAGLTDLARTPQNRDIWLEALVAHPALIQRPILTADDGTTVVGRDDDALATAIAAERTA